ncbi:hypothetical protein P691DRAFT_807254 [Macrolepiota fuliginosa MF-IS2]|uniref:Uncharacterized protein n=1 Tax=Macrolepiota fuliginosa MF-IS2 TaxID=1400762 RepID=A0A9P5XHQ8_9AGAR|nr:hypothetical protein P691DRAFT_807254 [Macrolepiota fuliginosa MF-IS2]
MPPSRNSPPLSPVSPTSPRRKQQTVPPGFRPSPRPKQRPIAEMTLRELQDLHRLNSNILSSPGASTSTYVQRILAEQAAVESRLIELDGMETINIGLKNTRISGENDMIIDPTPEPSTSRTLEAKKKALARFGQSFALGPNHGNGPSGFSMQEAMELERQAFVKDKEREERIIEKKRRQGIPIKGEILTRQEREARIWAFMNHKPTESDLEDDSDMDSDDDDPSTWFEDDQDDGRKGQDIVEPDDEDFSDVIRIDESRIRYSTFYEPRDEGD